jgi:glycosyltransferase involved in cell wall biosynthesis
VKVALDITPGLLIRTGVGRYPARLAEELDAIDGIEVQRVAAVEAPSESRLPRLAEAVAREGVFYPLQLARLANRGGAHLVHCTHPAPVRGGKLPVAVTVHDLFPLRHPELFPRPTVLHLRACLPSLRRARLVLTNSEYTRAEVIELIGVEPDRVHVTLFGIEDSFHPVEPDRDRLRHRFGIDGPFVLAVGTLEPRKNLERALEAFKLASRERPDVKLALVGGEGWGDGPLRRALDEPGLPVVTTGFVTDEELRALYSAAECLLFPSLWEGFGFPPLEAMACGAPVVTSDRPAIPEVVGDAAITVNPTDPEQIAAGLLRVLNDPALADSLRAKGLERSARFTWAACAEATASAYRAAVSES